MWKIYLLTAVFLFADCMPAIAHFGMSIPSRPVIENAEESKLSVEFSFSHPMERQGMELVKPEVVQVWKDGKAESVLNILKPISIMNHGAWQLEYPVSRPGLYAFTMQPQPYWEPAEDCYIVHYTKTYVSVFGEEEGWDEPLGLKTEIVPLTRPFGNYTGNVFQGQVLLDGKPVPHAEVEIEYYNRDSRYIAPDGSMITQVIRADDRGIFTYGIPFAGWWGFAALNTADKTMAHNGEPKSVELGAVLWTQFSDPLIRQ